MFCKNCGFQVPENQPVCPQCGQNMDVAPAQNVPQYPQQPPVQVPQPAQKKPITKKWWFWVLIVLGVLILISIVSGGGKKSSENTPGETSAKTAASDSSESAEPTKNDKGYELGEPTISVWTDSIGSKWIKVSVSVKNTGSDNLYLSSGTFDIENSDGSLIDTLSLVSAFPQIIQPGETAYYYEETLFESDETENLNAILHPDIEKAKAECIRFEVSEITVKEDDYLGTKVLGRIKNTSDEEQSLVYVVANLFDANGELLAQEFTILDNPLDAGEKISFETASSSFDFSASEVVSYEIFAFPNQMQF